MASKPSSVFDESDRHLTRLRKMCEAASAKALLQLLKWINPKWKPPMSFKDYLKIERKVHMKALNNSLKVHQRNVLRKDPHGSTYDISLLYVLILWGNEGLAKKDDEIWQKKSGCIEYLITSVKNVRNDLMHSYAPIDATEFLQRTETLRNLLKDMINSATTMCQHISQAEFGLTFQDLNILINKIRDDPLEPKDFEEYKKQLMFPQQQDFLKNKGGKALLKRHNKFTSLNPVSRLANVVFPVDDVFTDMELEGGSQQKAKLQLQDILKGENQSLTDRVIFIEGDAGVGKTTLTKKLVSVWSKKIKEIEHLETFDLVMHAECREHIESFKGLLDSSMAEISQNFQGEDMTFVTLSLKCLIIIDGFDELNKKSTRLFKEVLQLQKDYNITVFVTSRPEAVEKYYGYTRSHQIETKHIRLLGIPLEKREEFVKKYYDGIEKTGLTKQDVNGLLHYLRRTEHSLGYLWKSPYNLSIITILWSMKSDIVNSITTSSELHWEIIQLSLSKLNDRLLNNETTQHLSSSGLDRKINHFFFTLCRESLHALVNDDVTLPEEVYKRFETTCHELEIPVEEMVGAFLKKTITSSGIRYSYPHKGVEDFLAAYFIFLRLTSTFLSSDIQKVIKAFTDALTKSSAPLHVCHSILRFSEAELMQESSQKATSKHQIYDNDVITKGVDDLTKNTVPGNVRQNIIRFTKGELQLASSQNINQKPNVEDPQGIVESWAGPAVKGRAITRIIMEETGQLGMFPEMPKLQNMFAMLLGLLYVDNRKSLDESTKMEALTLLQQTGLSDKDSWLNILNSVKCDEQVALFVVEQSEILEGDVFITDSSLSAYISLMKALKPSLKEASEVSVHLDIKGAPEGIDKLLQIISTHQYQIETIMINGENVKGYTAALKSLTMSLKDSHEVNVDVYVNKDLLVFSELMVQVKKNNLKVRMLDLGESTYRISKDNLTESLALLKSLPLLIKGACENTICVDMKKECPGLVDLLREVGRNPLTVEVQLEHELKNPTFQPELEDAIKWIFKRCSVKTYHGALMTALTISTSVKHLFVNIVNNQCYQSIVEFLKNEKSLTILGIVVPSTVEASELLTIPHMRGATSIIVQLLDVKDTALGIEWACKVLKKLQPSSRVRYFKSIGFPRSTFSVQQIHELIQNLSGVRIEEEIIFPSNVKPPPKEESDLQKLAENTLSCRILWGEWTLANWEPLSGTAQARTGFNLNLAKLTRDLSYAKAKLATRKRLAST